MSVPNSSFLVKDCIEKDPLHPCDNNICDPTAETDECEEPFVCLERLKNAYLKSERTRCLAGSSLRAKTCIVPEPDHPCDGIVPCSLKGKRRNCKPPVLCEHRIKNPEIPKRPITTDCDPTK